jgi:adenylosuccinate synthase
MSVLDNTQVLAVVGGQYGSEGKGVIVRRLADQFNVHVRTGGANAGHSYYHAGKKFVSQTLPIGWTNKDAKVIIGAGAILDLEQLQTELEEIKAAGLSSLLNRLYIDRNAVIVDKRHHDAEGGVDGELHKRIGSTGHGIGATRIARIKRDLAEIDRVVDVIFKYPMVDATAHIANTANLIHVWMKQGQRVLLEGTQGSALSLIHGNFPYVTSADTNAAQLAADAGIPPHRVNSLLVFRTYPIRVAGNSGNLPNEITWEELSAKLGKPVQEKTTVTKKVRRIGEWDWEDARQAVILNDPLGIALTFCDYVDPSIEGVTTKEELAKSDKVMTFIHQIEDRLGVPVVFAGTGIGKNGQWSLVNLED